jgi:multidrug efflux pump
MVTQGIRLGGYRPDDADEEVDIRVRFPFDERNLAQLVNLRVPTVFGLVPINNFVEFKPAPKTGIIKRVDGQRTLTLTADAAPGYLVDQQVRRLQEALAAEPLPEEVQVRFRGQAEEQAEAIGFLVLAFSLSLFLMFLILVTQFNSLYQAVLVLSAIVFSTAGVLLGLMLRQEPFGIVMSGVGVIALAGIVVNNNIVLIDTFDYHHPRSDADGAGDHGRLPRARFQHRGALYPILGAARHGHFGRPADRDTPDPAAHADTPGVGRSRNDPGHGTPAFGTAPASL